MLVTLRFGCRHQRLSKSQFSTFPSKYIEYIHLELACTSWHLKIDNKSKHVHICPFKPCTWKKGFILQMSDRIQHFMAAIFKQVKVHWSQSLPEVIQKTRWPTSTKQQACWCEQTCNDPTFDQKQSGELRSTVHPCRREIYIYIQSRCP